MRQTQTRFKIVSLRRWLLSSIAAITATVMAADLLWIPSRSEAAPLVIGEAACLGTPILSTKTSSALEMIQETGFGWVCENSVQSMMEALVGLLSQPEQLDKISRELKHRQFTDEASLSQFHNCIG